MSYGTLDNRGEGSAVTEAEAADRDFYGFNKCARWGCRESVVLKQCFRSLVELDASFLKRRLQILFRFATNTYHAC